MKTANQIMDAKMFIKAEIDKKFSNGDELWEEAETRLETDKRDFFFFFWFFFSIGLLFLREVQ